ncbi:MAG: hypothetical protein AMXMBFR84_08410 [Candidatus Hydrogenedentota bacterium]
MNSLKPLTEYTCWANRTWLDFTFGGAANDEYLRKMISHVYLAEQIWFQRILGEPLRTDVFSVLTKEELDALSPRMEARYDEILDTDLSRVLKYTRLNGEPLESQIGDILHHLVTHGSHHRGQMARHASQLGIQPPETSFIGFTRR